MGIALFVILTWLATTGKAATAKVSSCIECHESMPGPGLKDVVDGFAGDIHAARGLGCQDCHGGDAGRGAAEGDPELAHDPAKGFVGAPLSGQIPDFCGRCHSDVEFMKKYNPKLRVDQLLEYRSSHHGKALASGNVKVATCVSCHNVHGILAVNDTRAPIYKTNVATTCGKCHGDATYMRGSGLPTDQLALYRTSVHGQKLFEKGDLSAPTCNNCHGNHGATPPGLTSVANTCGECHANNRDFFNQSPHKDAFAAMGLGECTACHRHHDIAAPADSMLGTGPGSMCVTCHSEGDAGWAAAAGMHRAMDSLKTTLADAHLLLDRASRGGIDVALGKFDLHAADDALIKARTSVHFFDTAKFAEVASPGIAAAAQVIQLGSDALDDLRMRRVGLAFSIPLVLLVALLLYLKIRKMERDKPFA